MIEQDPDAQEKASLQKYEKKHKKEHKIHDQSLLEQDPNAQEQASPQVHNLP